MDGLADGLHVALAPRDVVRAVVVIDGLAALGARLERLPMPYRLAIHVGGAEDGRRRAMEELACLLDADRELARTTWVVLATLERAPFRRTDAA